jgi:hypothetical protein
MLRADREIVLSAGSYGSASQKSSVPPHMGSDQLDGSVKQTGPMIFEGAGVLPQGHLFVGPGLILMVLGYRAVLSLIGCYLTARLAPRNPMAHALSLGVIGTIFSAVGTIAMADRSPAWYGWMLTALAMPIAWLGAKLYELRRQQPA